MEREPLENRLPPAGPISGQSRRGNTQAPAPTPAPTSRTTPKRVIRFRPGWHKAMGAALLLVGLAVVVLNDVMMLQPSVTLLPGGHSELYLIAGVGIAGYSTWWFGWFDRTR